MTKIFIEAKNNKTSEYHFLQAIINNFLPEAETEFIFMNGIGHLFNETILNQIKLAQEMGEHVIVFADADDQFLDIFSLENLYECAKEGEYDALNSTFFEELEDGSLVKRKNDWIWVFGKIYKRSFLEENSIYFNDTRANEDMGFNSVVITVGKIGNYDGTTYLWKFNPNSITRKEDGMYAFTCVEGWLENIKWGISECKRLGVNEEILKQISVPKIKNKNPKIPKVNIKHFDLI